MAVAAGQLERLPCGVALAELIEQVADGAAARRPEHQARCPFCQEALYHLRAAFGELRELARDRVRVPATLATTVMRRLRRESHKVVLAEGVLGRDTIDDRLVAQLAYRAARGVPDVHYASAVADTAPGAVAIRMRIAVAFGPSIPQVADRVREQVRGELARLLGAEPSRIDVVVDEVQ